MNDWVNDIHQGDVIERLSEMPESSVHMCMTSPPFWNLRDYGEEDQLGLEETSEEFVQNMADVFDEVYRVLRDDGSLWLNLGDTYDDKDLQQIPARVALELQNRGWILRNRVTWAKPNPMPQSVKDRLNDTTEAIFHFVKDKSYWYDLDSIREDFADATYERGWDVEKGKRGDKWNSNNAPGNHNQAGGLDSPGLSKDKLNPKGKNPGDVFEVTTKPFPEAHFAVYPPELVEKPIKSSCPPKVCADCGTPYDRDVERTTTYDHNTTAESDNHDRNDLEGGDGHDIRNGCYSETEFKGWEQSCDCETDETKPGITLDSFTGSGTTLLKAKELGRQFVGIELNPEYVAMAQKRVGITVDEPEYLLEDGETTLGAFGD